MDVAAHLEEPGAERSFRLVGMAVLQDAVKHLLHQVLGRRTAGGQVQEKMKQGPVMAVEELFQLPDVARPDVQHDLFVFHFNSVYV
jgi:hypothetical protein